jgi:hypothetical protein
LYFSSRALISSAVSGPASIAVLVLCKVFID